MKKTSKIHREKIKEFENDFNILSIQRNLKIIGIFYRLFKRDKKKQYLRFIPYTWELIEMRSNQQQTIMQKALKNTKNTVRIHQKTKKNAKP